jgi:hypothetical protein
MGDACRLTLVHDEFDGETKTYREVEHGWSQILSGLKTLIETGKPLVVEEPAEEHVPRLRPDAGLAGLNLPEPGAGTPPPTSLRVSRSRSTSDRRGRDTSPPAGCRVSSVSTVVEFRGSFRLMASDGDRLRATAKAPGMTAAASGPGRARQPQVR